MSGADLVLIVDDDPTVLNVTQQIVMRFGFATEVAESGPEGLRIVEQRIDEVKCVLLDMSMPGMDGAETFRQLRRLRPGLPVILISGFPEDDLVEHFSEDRPFAFLQKPYSITEIDALLRQATAQLRPTRRRPASGRAPFGAALSAT